MSEPEVSREGFERGVGVIGEASIMLVYQCENSIGTNARWKIPSARYLVRGGEQYVYRPVSVTFEPGVCCAQSLLFCDAFLRGGPDAETKPNYHRAAILQQKAEMAYQKATMGTKVEAQENDILDVLGLKVVARHEFDGETLAKFPPKDGKVCMLRLPGHAIAVASRDGYHYYFEPMEGLYRFSSLSDYTEQLQTSTGSSFTKKWVQLRIERDQ